MTATGQRRAADPAARGSTGRCGRTSRCVPHSPLRAAIAARIFRGAVRRLPLQGHRAGRRELRRRAPWRDPVHGACPAGVVLRPPRRHGHDRVRRGYMAGDWTAEDLAGCARRVRREHAATWCRPRCSGCGTRVLDRQPASHDNTVEGARENIHHHYDLSNDLFATFLDESMTYSSAIFDGEPATSTEDLADAQRRKIDRLLDAAERRRTAAGVLEIGTGWGELAIRAADRGATVTSLTISTEQAELARRRIADAGLTDRVTVLLQRLPRGRGQYDAVVSVEMIEAVGANHWDEYFGDDRPAAGARRPGRPAGDPAGRPTRCWPPSDTYTWIRKYIFPGGQIASVEAIERTLAALDVAARDRQIPVRQALCRDTAALAHHVRGQRTAGRGPRFRRDVPPHVVAVPRVLRGRIPHRLPRRSAIHPEQAGGVTRSRLLDTVWREPTARRRAA